MPKHCLVELPPLEVEQDCGGNFIWPTASVTAYHQGVPNDAHKGIWFFQCPYSSLMKGCFPCLWSKAFSCAFGILLSCSLILNFLSHYPELHFQKKVYIVLGFLTTVFISSICTCYSPI